MMRKIFSICILQVLIFSLSSCTSLTDNSASDELIPDEIASEDILPEGETDDFADFEAEVAAEEPVAQESGEITEDPLDEFADFEAPEASEQALAQEPATTLSPEDELLLDDVPESTDVAQDDMAGGLDEFAIDMDDPDLEIAADELPTEPESPEPELGSNFEEPAITSPGEMAPAAPVETPAITSTSDQTEIQSVQFKAHETGGTLIVQGNRPMTFSTRKNPENNQLILEIRNAILPDKFKRPLNMKDMQGSIGAVDAYQELGSTTARFVVQLRAGAPSPFVITEGNTLLVVADPLPQLTAALSPGSVQKDLSKGSSTGEKGTSDQILTSRTLQEFLAGNTKFYGKKISLETNSMPVRDALRFISEEAGVNMIIADNIQGNVSLKLREVPWDQAFIVIMKTKDLGYVRQGNVLRIATLNDLKKEEEAAIALTTARLKVEPLVVKVFPINYAKVDDLATKLKDFLSERGKATGDVRTNTVVITDVPQNLERISQLVQSLDTQPPQVLIEGRIIEATDSFQRQLGVNWFAGGSNAGYRLGQSSNADIVVRPTLNIQTGVAASSSLNLNLSTFDILGNINATLSLNELENKIRTLSSPRIVTLSNEKATINQKISIPIPTIQTTAAGTQTTYAFRDLELKLEVTPQITSNASVIMNIVVKREIQGARINDQLSVESREASTKVMVRNGQTSVIGGVYQNDLNELNQGVPVLKDIPVLGSLFRTKNTDTRRTELMIFLTPRIVAAGFAPNEGVLNPSLGKGESVNEIQ